MKATAFTVFTATFNRAATLDRVYRSLLKQTFRDFEWVVVDDGSSDDTRLIVAKWMREASFRITYEWQPNAGKHVAFNRGVRLAQGHFFLPLDSDDECLPNTLAAFHAAWSEIPLSTRNSFSGVTCLCQDQYGRIVGGPLPDSYVDGRPYELIKQLRRTGEMWGFHRTEVLRTYPFPEDPSERFVPEGLVWNRIATAYNVRMINAALRIYHDSGDSLSSKSVQIRVSNPRSTVTYYSELIELPLGFALRYKAATNIWRFSILSRQRRLCLPALLRHPMLMTSSCFTGVLLAFRDWVIQRPLALKRN